MKVNVTCMDCEITVEEIDGKCVVIAHRNGEEVESFEIDCEGDETEENEDDIEDLEDDIEDAEERLEEGLKTFDQFYKRK